jgi:hypothetical protein
MPHNLERRQGSGTCTCCPCLHHPASDWLRVALLGSTVLAARLEEACLCTAAPHAAALHTRRMTDTRGSGAKEDSYAPAWGWF